MEATIEIRELMILNGGSEITIYGTKFQEHLSYPMSCCIESTQLNKILNYLQSRHDNVEISALFEHYIDATGSRILFLNASKLGHKCIPSTLIFENPKHFAIRA